jgi:hypothetical protein
MRITTIETIQKVKTLLETYDADTERFLDELPTREKYAILALAMMICEEHDDFEAAYYEASSRISAQGLTKYLMEFPWLWCHLQDVVQIIERRGWDGFEMLCMKDSGDEDEDE